MLEALGRATDGGVAVADLVGVLGGHPNTVRHHLAALTVSGLAAAAPEPPSGRRGRPATRFVATDAGRAAVRSGQAVADEYIALAAAFADRLAGGGGDPGGDARAVGRAWAAGLAGGGTGHADPDRAVVELLDRLGFSPDRAPRRDEAADEGEVLLRTCPLLDAASRHPDVVCAVHRGLAEGAYAAFGGEPLGVGLRPFALPGACVLTLPALASSGTVEAR